MRTKNIYLKLVNLIIVFTFSWNSCLWAGSVEYKLAADTQIDDAKFQRTSGALACAVDALSNVLSKPNPTSEELAGMRSAFIGRFDLPADTQKHYERNFRIVYHTQAKSFYVYSENPRNGGPGIIWCISPVGTKEDPIIGTAKGMELKVEQRDTINIGGAEYRIAIVTRTEEINARLKEFLEKRLAIEAAIPDVTEWTEDAVDAFLGQWEDPQQKVIAGTILWEWLERMGGSVKQEVKDYCKAKLYPAETAPAPREIVLRIVDVQYWGIALNEINKGTRTITVPQDIADLFNGIILQIYTKISDALSDEDILGLLRKIADENGTLWAQTGSYLMNRTDSEEISLRTAIERHKGTEGMFLSIGCTFFGSEDNPFRIAVAASLTIKSSPLLIWSTTGTWENRDGQRYTDNQLLAHLADTLLEDRDGKRFAEEVTVTDVWMDTEAWRNMGAGKIQWKVTYSLNEYSDIARLAEAIPEDEADAVIDAILEKARQKTYKDGITGQTKQYNIKTFASAVLNGLSPTGMIIGNTESGAGLGSYIRLYTIGYIIYTCIQGVRTISTKNITNEADFSKYFGGKERVRNFALKLAKKVFGNNYAVHLVMTEAEIGAESPEIQEVIIFNREWKKRFEQAKALYGEFQQGVRNVKEVGGLKGKTGIPDDLIHNELQEYKAEIQKLFEGQRWDDFGYNTPVNWRQFSNIFESRENRFIVFLIVKKAEEKAREINEKGGIQVKVDGCVLSIQEGTVRSEGYLGFFGESPEGTVGSMFNGQYQDILDNQIMPVFQGLAQGGATINIQSGDIVFEETDTDLLRQLKERATMAVNPETDVVTVANSFLENIARIQRDDKDFAIRFTIGWKSYNTKLVQSIVWGSAKHEAGIGGHLDAGHTDEEKANIARGRRYQAVNIAAYLWYLGYYARYYSKGLRVPGETDFDFELNAFIETGWGFNWLGEQANTDLKEEVLAIMKNIDEAYRTNQSSVDVSVTVPFAKQPLTEKEALRIAMAVIERIGEEKIQTMDEQEMLRSLTESLDAILREREIAYTYAGSDLSLITSVLLNKVIELRNQVQISVSDELKVKSNVLEILSNAIELFNQTASNVMVGKDINFSKAFSGRNWDGTRYYLIDLDAEGIESELQRVLSETSRNENFKIIFVSQSAECEDGLRDRINAKGLSSIAEDKQMRIYNEDNKRRGGAFAGYVYRQIVQNNIPADQILLITSNDNYLTTYCWLDVGLRLVERVFCKGAVRILLSREEYELIKSISGMASYVVEESGKRYLIADPLLDVNGETLNRFKEAREQIAKMA